MHPQALSQPNREQDMSRLPESTCWTGQCLYSTRSSRLFCKWFEPFLETYLWCLIITPDWDVTWVCNIKCNNPIEIVLQCQLWFSSYKLNYDMIWNSLSADCSFPWFTWKMMSRTRVQSVKYSCSWQFKKNKHFDRFISHNYVVWFGVTTSCLVSFIYKRRVQLYYVQNSNIMAFCKND